MRTLKTKCLMDRFLMTIILLTHIFKDINYEINRWPFLKSYFCNKIMNTSTDFLTTKPENFIFVPIYVVTKFGVFRQLYKKLFEINQI